MLRPLVLALCLALPLAAQVTLGPERLVTTSVPVPSTGTTQVEIASNGTISLVVWQEIRASVPDIYAARIDAEGNLLDPYSIQLSNTPHRVESLPHVVWDGDAFLVIWTSVPIGPVVTTEAMATRVFPNGDALHPIQFGTGVTQSMTINNGRPFVALQLPSVANPSSSRCVAGFLDRERDFALTTAFQENCISPRVAPLGSGYVLVWTSISPETFVVRARRLNAIGEGDAIGPITLTELGEFTGGVTVAVGKSGSDAIVAAGSNRVGVVRVTPQLSQHRADSIAPDPGFSHPAAAVVSHPNGSYDVVLHHFSSSARVYRFSARDRLEAISDPEGSQVNSAHGTSIGGRSFAVFANGPVIGKFVFNEVGTHLISQRAAPQREVAMATNGSESILAWLEERGNEFPALVATRADRNGVPYGDLMIIDEQVDRGRPAVGSAGEGWWIAWTDERTVTPELHQTLVARHMTAHGHLSPEVVLSETANLDAAPAIATNGDSAVIVWAEDIYFDPKLYSAVLQLGARPQKHRLPTLASAPSIVWSGQRYFVAARDEDEQISAMWVNANGTPSSSPVKLLTTLDDGNNPSIAWNGERFLVAAEWNGGIHAVSVDKDGVPRNAALVAGGSMGKIVERPRAAWDGSSFVVSWNVGVRHLDTDIAARRLTADGQLSGVAAIVARTGLAYARHDLMSIGGTVVIAYSRAGESGAARLYSRVLLKPGLVKQRSAR